MDGRKQNAALKADEAIKHIAGIIGAWQRTPIADRYPTEIMRQALALRDIAIVLRNLDVSVSALQTGGGK